MGKEKKKVRFTEGPQVKEFSQDKEATEVDLIRGGVINIYDKGGYLKPDQLVIHERGQVLSHLLNSREEWSIRLLKS